MDSLRADSAREPTLFSGYVSPPESVEENDNPLLLHGGGELYRSAQDSHVPATRIEISRTQDIKIGQRLHI